MRHFWLLLLLGCGATESSKIVERHRGALALAGRVEAGASLFARHCANCHPGPGAGLPVGPDLAAIRTRDRERLLEDILDPNASVAPEFVSYTVVTTEEVIYNGLLSGQSPTGVTLRLQGGNERTIRRSDVEQLQSTGKSLMPEMFETVLSDQDLADLIEYLRQIR